MIVVRLVMALMTPTSFASLIRTRRLQQVIETPHHAALADLATNPAPTAKVDLDHMLEFLGEMEPTGRPVDAG